MRLFDTSVQQLKYSVLRELAKKAWNDRLFEELLDIPQIIVPGTKPSMRCCVYKEHAICAERVKIAMNLDTRSTRVITPLEIACDECPTDGYIVTEACRGCLSHRCVDVCRKSAVTYTHGRGAYIDKTRCVECGQCAKICPFSAIMSRKRPCQNACKLNAISTAEDGCINIDYDKCVGCGACVSACPFGAIVDKSFILYVIRMIKEKMAGSEGKLCAVLAPAISSQLTYAKLGQVVAGLRKLGFDLVVEAAHGADIVAQEESRELAERGFLISSCCPAFVRFVQNRYPNLAEHISSALSPMATIAKVVKEKYPGTKVVFIGPCTAKKEEIQLAAVRPYVDSALTFEELQALFDSRDDIDIASLEESPMDSMASYFGRIFARCGGLAAAVEEALKEQGITDFELKAISCDGLEECMAALHRKNHGRLDANFIEGMACVGGCIGGAGCLTHAAQGRMLVEKYGEAAGDLSITESAKDL